MYVLLMLFETLFKIASALCDLAFLKIDGLQGTRGPPPLSKGAFGLSEKF